MRKFLVPAALLLSVAAGSSAFAASTPAKVASTAATSPKAAACAQQWHAQKKHTQSKKAFLAACEKA